MNEDKFVAYRFFDQEQSLFILDQVIKEPINGCLQVFSGSHYWSLYLENGKLIYACSSSDGMFELIYKKLYQLSKEVAQIFKTVYKELNHSFSGSVEEKHLIHLDYWAICWLVSHKLISGMQAGIIIGELALEIFPLFLKLEEGFYQISHHNALHQMPRFCHLDVNVIISRVFNDVKDHKNARDHNDIELSVMLDHTFNDFNKSLHSKKNKHQKIHSINKNSHTIDTNQAVFSPRKGAPHTPQNNKLYKIACIDDSPTMLHIINSFLDAEFFTVELIDNPLVSLMQIIRTKPDLILLDISMPNLDGYQLCSWIRRNSEFKNIPVIMVTGKTGFINKAKAKMVRATDYLTKPFTQEQLLTIINKYLS
ncbi:response regulator [Calothrix rhizosoleniae]|uniref:response regulator n=1 Tax=Calothrix rhizosoleniae TaxID=888997 RepID=UPI000B4A2E29|nr:response regulator [Calothrix rhizosoleniae]